MEMFLSDGTRLDAKKIAWIEACVTEGKERERRLKESLGKRIFEAESNELAMRLAYDFLYSNSNIDSHAGRVCHVLRRVLKGKTQLAGSEHAIRAGIEAGISPSDKVLGI